MRLAALALAAGTVVGLVLGGSLRNLAPARLRSLGLVVAGAACAAVAWRWVPGAAGMALLIGGYALLLVFATRNVMVPGMVLIALGLLANATVMTLDGGMPVQGAAPGVSLGPHYHGRSGRDRLAGLGDVVRLPALGEIVSGGDLVVAAGAATAMAALVRDRRRRGPAALAP